MNPRVVAVFRRINDVNRHVSENLLGGPRIKLAWVINAQKGSTLLFCLALMAAWNNFSTAAWLYAALHGSYGLIWLLKDRVLPDPNWERQVTLPSACVAWLFVLGPYWLAPVILITDILPTRLDPSPLRMGISTLLYVVGVVVMMASDAQKYFTLRVRRGLITEGMFSRIRHPNYLGEMMLYGSFALLVGHWLPWLVLAWVWGILFSTNIVMKEVSMARYPEWPTYRARTGMLLPRLWGASVAVKDRFNSTPQPELSK